MDREAPSVQPENVTQEDIARISGVDISIISWLFEKDASPKKDADSYTFALHEPDAKRIGIESITCSNGQVHFNVSFPIGHFIENEIDTAIDTLIMARFSRAFINGSQQSGFTKTFKPHEYGFIDCWSTTCGDIASFQAAFSQVENSISEATERMTDIHDRVLELLGKDVVEEEPTSPVLTFEEFSYRTPEDNWPRYNNFVLFFRGDQRLTQTEYFKQLCEEQPALVLKIILAFQGVQFFKGRRVEKFEKMKQIDPDLYEAYKIMRSYGAEDEDLLR